jgi:tetratricopeptide (TPR) repeat protein
MSALTAVSLTLGGVLYQDQRARVAEAKARQATQELRERQRHEEVQQLVLEGRQAVAKADWQGAKLYLTRALDRIDPGEPLLEELRAQGGALLQQAERSLAEQKARQEALAQYQNDFLPQRDRALFHATLAAGADQPLNVKAAREAARGALALFEVHSQDRGSLPLDAALAAEDKRQILAGCYELLLVLADAEAEALPGEGPEDQLRQALRTLDRAASLGCPGHPTQAYHLRRARYLEQLGDETGAKEERRQAAARPPGTALDYYLLGDEHYKQGDVREAANDFAGALKLQPDHFWARYFLAICDLMQERPADARAELNDCLRQQPRLPWLYVLRGFANGQLQDFPSAQGDFEQALKLEPGEDAAYALYANRGVLWFQQGKFDEAAADLRKAVGLKPKEYQAYVPLAQVYQKQNRRAEAVAQLDRAIEVEPELAFLYRLRARLQLERGDFPAALRDADRAIAAEKPSGDSPTLARDYAEKGRILYHAERYQEAVAAYEESLKIQPAYPTAHLGRADAELKLRHYAEAVHSLDAYLQDGGKHLATVFQARGLARSRLGDQPGAVEDYAVALTLKPDDPGAIHLARGWAYLARVAPQLALPDFDQVIRIKPDDSAAYAGRGYALVQLGRYQQAAEAAEAALRRGPETAPLVYDAARIYAQAVGKMDADPGPRQRRSLETRSQYQGRALELLRRALRLHPVAERHSFWQDRVVPDVALGPLRRSPEFTRLEMQYSRGTSEN